MGEKKEEKIIDSIELNWKKAEDYRARFSDAVAVTHGETYIALDFGVFETEGKIGESDKIRSIKPYLEYHTRIIITNGDFKGIMAFLIESQKE